FLYLKAPINSQVSVYDLLGNEIYNGIINNNIYTIDFKPYSSGIYIMQLKDKNINKTIKIVKN
ncbi:MAG TPA: T9SS type A sorting domain-containing protein, partial [Bacteroidales bacterium]|nr:T9SS type A sorting domain-containing protein [Bacteroidales bacterium]